MFYFWTDIPTSLKFFFFYWWVWCKVLALLPDDGRPPWRKQRAAIAEPNKRLLRNWTVGGVGELRVLQHTVWIFHGGLNRSTDSECDAKVPRNYNKKVFCLSNGLILERTNQIQCTCATSTYQPTQLGQGLSEPIVFSASISQSMF